ncbi:hypothetical protein [Nonomuraea sp. CA-141351]|uniref:hypothetical protein n=1 Tax=Nonomuraea sp. CA-141351 TaxID=3239996 RepID=UPI003D93F2E7
MFTNRRIRRTCLAVVVGLPLFVGTAGVSNAESTPEQGVFACPVSGQRFRMSGSSRVYLVGPDNVAYAIADQSVYFALWNTWDGISEWPNDTVSSCFGGAFLWTETGLVKGANDPRVYIWDQRDAGIGGYRWITSQAIFNKYSFAPNKIQVRQNPPVITSTDNWDN